MIETPRLRLRPLTLDDAPAFHVIWGDPDVIWWGATTSLQESSELLARVIARTAGRDDLAWFAMHRRDSGELVGDVVLEPAPWDAEVVEIGWHVAKDAQGRGYATEGAQALCDHATRVGITHVEATIVPNNEPSCRVAEKLGMTVVGSLLRGGLDHDLWALDLPATIPPAML